MRRTVAILMILAGVALTAVSYFLWAAPWCATSVGCSDPRVPWASGLVVAGVLLAFSSAIFYVVYGEDD